MRTEEGIAIDTAVRELADDARGLLEALVRAPSTVGHETEAQNVLSAALATTGFEVRQLAIDESVPDDPAAGVPQHPYVGRYNVLADRGSGHPHIVLNGHIDVVPATEPGRWVTSPYDPSVRDGWLHGRGAGDMKGGFAMGWLAIAALDRAHPGWQAGRLSVLSVLEEECTGNGTLAMARAGFVGDAVVLLEPTDLRLLLGGVGVIWFEIEVVGSGGHAVTADRASNAIDLLLSLVEGLRTWESELNRVVDDPLLEGVDHPYNLNLGTVSGGDWPSSVPAVARLGCRLGFPRSWSPSVAEARVRAVVEEIAASVEWLRDHSPVVRLTGLRASGYALSPYSSLAQSMATAHHEAHGSYPPMIAQATTTDARFYVNNFDVPALCYGPRTRAIHAVDEAVDLASVEAGARTLARFLVCELGSAETKERHAESSARG